MAGASKQRERTSVWRELAWFLVATAIGFGVPLCFLVWWFFRAIALC